ncbi:MAG: c-type cytochrome [Anaerolineae bacterium]|nr:c-type cytochrome [Anaerolineae bacterium]
MSFYLEKPFLLVVLLVVMAGAAALVTAAQANPPEEAGYPLTVPDMVVGAAVYTEYCAACHGVSGHGDGPKVGTDEAPDAPPDMTDPALAASQTPFDWFTTITQGRPDKHMPAWGDQLAEDDRWSVALYTYLLAHSPEQIAQGQTVWVENCQECHGESGRGDGPRAREIHRPIGNLTEQSEIVTLSDKVLFNIANEGIGDTMPAFMDKLSAEQLHNGIAYVRTLTVANPDALAQQAEVTPEAEILPGTINGRVTNGTAFGEVPAGLTVQLLVSNGVSTQTFQTTIDGDHVYRFENVPLTPANQYVVAAVYRERVFSSAVVPGAAAVTEMTLPLTIYDLTEDPTVIRITSVITQATVIGEDMEVRQAFTFENTSDRLFTSSNAVAEGHFATLVVKTPPGAQIVPLDDTGRYALNADGTALIDTAPVVPGDGHSIFLVYLIPYDNNSAIIEQELTYPLAGSVRLEVAPESLEVTADQLTAGDPLTRNTTTFEIFSGDLSLKPGDVLRYTLRGAVAAAVTDVRVSTPSRNTIPLLLIIGGGAVLVIALELYLLRRSALSETMTRERLITALEEQIAELDDLHHSGHLNHDLWHRQRAGLEARLAELMGATKGETEDD